MHISPSSLFYFRDDLLCFLFSGCQFGTVVTLSISGWLSQTEWGWPSVFYLFGVLGLVWGWFWFRYAYDSPDQHPRITAAEKLFIKQGIGDHRKSEVNKLLKFNEDTRWKSERTVDCLLSFVQCLFPFIAFLTSFCLHSIFLFLYFI